MVLFVVVLLVLLEAAAEDERDLETIEDTIASTVVVFATSSSVVDFLVVAFSRLLILSVKLVFFSLAKELVLDEMAEASVLPEVKELERKEVDIVKVLRIGRVPKVVSDLEPVRPSTVVVSTLDSSLMNVTLSLEDDLLSIAASD